MTITIDEIKKLDAARSKGHWSCDLYASVWRVVCEDNTLAEEPESEISYKLLSDGSSEPIDIMLMAAAPQIAAKCLELDAEVTRLNQVCVDLANGSNKWAQYSAEDFHRAEALEVVNKELVDAIKMSISRLNRYKDDEYCDYDKLDDLQSYLAETLTKAGAL